MHQAANKTFLKTISCAIFLFLQSAFPARVLLCAPQLDNQTFQNLQNISRAFESSGRLNEAIQLLMPHNDDPRVLALLADLLEKAGLKKELLELAREAYRDTPADWRVVAVYLKALDSGGYRDSVREAAYRYLDQAPDREAAFLQVGNQLREFQMYDEALKVYRKGRAELSRERAFSREVSEVLIDLGQYDKALDELLAFIGEHPADQGISQRQLYRIFNSGEPGKGLVLSRLEKALDKSQDKLKANILSLQVDLCLSAGHSDQAFAKLQLLMARLETREAHRQLTLFLGRCLKLEQYAPALQAYALADSLGMIGPGPSLLGRSEILLRMGRFGEVESSLLELVNSNENQNLRLEAMNRLGRLYLENLNRPAEALHWYREVEKLNKAQAQALFQTKLRIVESFIRLEQLDEAEQLCNELLSGQENQAERSGAVLLRADLYFYRGEPDSAALAYLEFARLSLGGGQANDALERVYLVQNDRSPETKISRLVGQALYQAHSGDLQQAAGIFSNCLREVQDSLYKAQIIYQMGKMYETAKEYSLALGVFSQMAQAYPQDHLTPLAELRMGLILLDAVQDTVGARKHFEKVVYEFPPGVATPQARRILRTLENDKL